MPDPSITGLNQSEQILRDIRDELRTTRQAATGQGMSSSRPTPQFIHAQQTMDRMVAGQWATLGWASAYQQPIHSSLANDIMGTMGLRAAPQSMWQREYESFAGSMLGSRVSNFLPDLVMPGFGRNSREMGAQLYQLSGRFNRAGDGRDTSIGGAMSMARDMQIGAARDMRLSGGDYNAILGESSKAGQFDMAGGIGDVKTQFNALKDAVADLTKTMRMGASEVAQTLGAFRQFGIVDVADQRRTAEHMSAAARVAGISTPEMAGMVRTGIEGGMQYGLGAAGSAALTGNLVMAAREASRTGLISGNIMSAGGGVQGIVGAQQRAIDAFAGSSAGFYTALGAATGGGGNALDDILRGVGVTGGTMGGVMAAEARRMDLMGGMSGGQRQRLYNRNISQQLSLIGIDPNSAEATDAAFSLVRGQMGDAAGLTYARQNFSAEGRRQRWGSAYRQEAELVRQGDERNYQRKMENESTIGQIRQFSGEMGASLAGGMRTVGGWAHGLGVLTHAINGNFEDSARGLDAGGESDMSADALASAVNFEGAARSAVRGAGQEDALRLMGSVGSKAGFWGTSMRLSGVAGGAYLGGKLGAIGGAFLGPVGALVGGVAGAVGGGLLGGMAGTGLGSMFGLNTNVTELTGEDAKAYRSAFGASKGDISQRVLNVASGKEGETMHALNNTASFKELMSKVNRGDMSDTDSTEFARLAASAARESGQKIDAGDVVGIARSLGMDAKMADSYTVGHGSTDGYRQSMRSLLGNAESTNAALASSEVAAGVRAFAQAGEDVDKKHAAMFQLREAGISGASLQGLTTEIGKMSAEARTKIADDAAEYVHDRGSTTLNRRLRGVAQMATGLASEAASQQALGGRDAVERMKDLSSSPSKLLDILIGKGDDKDADLRRVLINQDDTGVLRQVQSVGKIEDLMSSSQDSTLQKLTGMSATQLDGTRKAAQRLASSEPGTDVNMLMKRMLSSQMLMGSQAVKQASDPMNVAANNMLLAANILKEIQAKISGDASTKAASK